MTTTRVLMVANAVLLLVIGIVFLFLPDAIASRMNPGTVLGPVTGAAGTGAAARSAAGQTSVLVQLAGAGAIGFAVLNWMGRRAIYGGIYGRPIVIANLGFGLIASLTLAGWLLDTGGTPAGWALTVAFSLYFAASAIILTRRPWEERG